MSRGAVEPAQEPDEASLNVFDIKTTIDWIVALQRDNNVVNSLTVKLDDKKSIIMTKYAIEDGRLYRPKKGDRDFFYPKSYNVI